MKTKGLVFAILLLWQVGFAQTRSTPRTMQLTILATAQADDSLHMFTNAVRLSGMAEMLNGPDHLTVLALSDKAFDRLPPDLRHGLMEQPHVFSRILSHYTIPGNVMATDFANLGSIRSMDGLNVRFEEVDGRLRVQNSNVRQADIICTNGVIHVLDTLDPALIHQVLFRYQQESKR